VYSRLADRTDIGNSFDADNIKRKIIKVVDFLGGSLPISGHGEFFEHRERWTTTGSGSGF
jgi:hypothetical protein